MNLLSTSSMGQVLSLFYYLFLFLICFRETRAYPSYLLDPNEGCAKKLEVGFSLMGKAAVADIKQGPTPIKVYRGGKSLVNGAEYVSGETLQVKIEGRTGQFCLEAEGLALFTGGECDGRRVAQEAELALPLGEEGTLNDIQIHAGMASVYGPVTILKPFVLKAPGSLAGQDPTEEPTPPPQMVDPGTAATGEIILPADMPRLAKSAILNKDTGMELSWTVGEKQDYVDIQVASKRHTSVSIGMIDGKVQTVMPPYHTYNYDLPEPRKGKAAVAGKGQTWVSIGVIDGKVQMVTQPYHKTILYPNQEGKAVLMELRAQRADGVVPVDMDPQEYEVLLTQYTADYTLLRYRHHQTTGSLLTPSSLNTVLYAHGSGSFPEMHDLADGKTIRWGADATAAVGEAEKKEPLMIPGVILLGLPLLVLPWLWGPLRRSVVGRWLLQQRLWRGPRELKGPLSIVKRDWAAAGSWRPLSTLKRDWAAAGSWRVGEVFIELLVLAALAGLAVHWYFWALALGMDWKRAAALDSGIVTITVMMLVTLPATKTGFWVRWVGLSFDRAVKFHRQLGRLALVTASVHLALSIKQGPLLWAPTDTVSVATAFGLVAYIATAFLALSALEILRRKMFDVFKWLHYVGAAAVYVFTFLHLPNAIEGLPYYVPIVYLGVPFVLYIIEWAWRTAKAALPTRLLSLKPLVSDVTKLTVKVMRVLGHHQPGQYYFLWIPEANDKCGGLQLGHPYSACGDSNDPNVLSFHIKDMGKGTWSHRVRELASKYQDQNTSRANLPTVKVDGPYGRLSIDLQDYQKILLIGGGIGITPLTSTLRYIRKQIRSGRLKNLRAVELIWAVREKDAINWFEDLLASFVYESQLQPVKIAKGTNVSNGETKDDISSSDDSAENKTVGLDEDGESKAGGGDIVAATTSADTVASSSSSSTSSRRATGSRRHAPLSTSSAAAAGARNSNNNSSDSMPFSLQIYVSNNVPPGGVTEGGLPYQAGRPQVDELVKTWIQDSIESEKLKPRDLALLVCGPEEMLIQSRNVAMKQKVAVHEEVFYW